jgi:DNA-binding NarL/FixJ family response regulator
MRARWRVCPATVILCDSDMPDIDRSAEVVTRGRLLAVDDDASFRALLRDVVKATAHLQIAGEADCGESAIAAARELRPDIVLMDIRMPGIGGMQAAERIRAADRSTLIVMISTMHPDEIPPDAYTSFADALLWKSTLKPRVLDEVWLQRRAQSAS